MKTVAEQRQKREEEIARRTELIRRARAGDEEAQRILSEPPYLMRVFTDKEIDAVEHPKKSQRKRAKKARKK